MIVSAVGSTAANVFLFFASIRSRTCVPSHRCKRCEEEANRSTRACSVGEVVSGAPEDEVVDAAIGEVERERCCFHPARDTDSLGSGRDETRVALHPREYRRRGPSQARGRLVVREGRVRIEPEVDIRRRRSGCREIELTWVIFKDRPTSRRNSDPHPRHEHSGRIGHLRRTWSGRGRERRAGRGRGAATLSRFTTAHRRERSDDHNRHQLELSWAWSYASWRSISQPPELVWA